MKRFLFLSVVLCLLFGIFLFWAPWKADSSQYSFAPSLKPFFRLAKAQIQTFSSPVFWSGHAISPQGFSLKTLEEGRLTFVAPKRESLVKKGEILFKIGGPLIKKEKETLQNRVKWLIKKRGEMTSMILRAREALSQKLASPDVLGRLRIEAGKLSRDLKNARLELKYLDQASIIYAPQRGYFLKIQVALGQKVAKDEGLAIFVPATSLRISATCFAHGPLLHQRVEIFRTNGKKLEGTVIRTLSRRDKRGGTLFWIGGSEVEKTILPGEKVWGNIKNPEHSALALPKSALVYDKLERPHVLIRKRSSFVNRQVVTGKICGGWVEIRKGLSSEDHVVIEGAYELYHQQFENIYQIED